MSLVNVDPKILNDLSVYISDIQQRTLLNTSDVRQKGEQILRQIADEVTKRQHRVEELTRLYESCCRDLDADCSELRRQLIKVRQSLDISKQSQQRAIEAIAEFKVKTNSNNERLGDISVAGKNTINRLKNNLDDYSAFSGLVATSVLGATFSSQGSVGTSSNTNTCKLSNTNQSYCKAKAGNRDILVFDHPTDSAKNAVINQGTAKPAEFEGTCGLCAAGSIIRKAGISVSEGDMIAYASVNDLCTTKCKPERNGGTTSNQLVSILGALAGISTYSEIGKTLEELTLSIEKGHGVIIGVNPSKLNPAWYGSYQPNISSGHWVVLESVVRDAYTNAILGYVIFDSNGNTPSNACQIIKASQLEDAYYIDGAVSLITDDVIW